MKRKEKNSNRSTFDKTTATATCSCFAVRHIDQMSATLFGQTQTTQHANT